MSELTLLRISSAKVRKPPCLTDGIAAPQKVPSASENIPELKQVAVEVQSAQVSSRAKKKSKRGPRGEAGDVDEIRFRIRSETVRAI
jgi:hypothetical protein